jgi:hypothetical protein
MIPVPGPARLKARRQVPYTVLAQRDITLTKGQRPGGYAEPDLPLRHIPTPF